MADTRIPPGAAIHFRKSTENPIFSQETRAAMAAFTCGFDLITNKGFIHTVDGEATTVEAIADSRSVTWLWDEQKTATFKPIPKEETISIQEFFRRFESLEWCADNPDHPISYMRVFLDKTRSGLKTIGGMRPCLRFRRGDDVATVPPDATAEDVEAYFDSLNE